MEGHENGTAGVDLVEDQQAAKVGRRAVVFGAAVAGAGFAAGLIGRASPAEAANGGSVLLGVNNTASDSTLVITSGGTGLVGVTSADGQYGVKGEDESTAGGAGVYGLSSAGTGVYGESSTDTGVYGQTSADGRVGVLGNDLSTGGGFGVWATSGAGTGVYGQASADGKNAVEGVGSGGANGVSGVSAAGVGVYGQTSGTGQPGVEGVDQSAGGTGVLGTSPSGVGVLAASTSGTALRVDGAAEFSSSGVATVAAKATSVVVSGVALTSRSVVLATPQGHAVGIAVAGVVTRVTAKKMTIYLTNAPTKSLVVAWFIINVPPTT